MPSNECLGRWGGKFVRARKEQKRKRKLETAATGVRKDVFSSFATQTPGEIFQFDQLDCLDW